MTELTGETFFDHFVRFLGKPIGSNAYSSKGFEESIQVLEFQNVFEGCATFATFGFGRMISKYFGSPFELVLAVDSDKLEAEFLLINTLFGVLANNIPLKEKISVIGPGRLPELANCFDQKAGFYFAEPVMFPSSFRVPAPGLRLILAIPITQKEHEFVIRHGGSKFEELLEKKNVDPFVVSRKSVI